MLGRQGRQDREELLQVPPMGPSPAVGGQIALEGQLPLGQIRRIREDFDALRAVRRDHPQLEPAGLRFARFISQILSASLKPPEHETLLMLFSALLPGRDRREGGNLREAALVCA